MAPYPTAAEIPAVRAAFNHLIQTLETQETDAGIQLREPDTVYNQADYDRAIESYLRERPVES